MPIYLSGKSAFMPKLRFPFFFFCYCHFLQHSRYGISPGLIAVPFMELYFMIPIYRR
jgi:hypothetical protein